MQCVTVTVKIRSQLAIGYAPTYADGACFTVQNHLVQVGQRDLVLRAVGDPVKGVASTQCPQLAAAARSSRAHTSDRCCRCNFQTNWCAGSWAARLGLAETTWCRQGKHRMS